MRDSIAVLTLVITTSFVAADHLRAQAPAGAATPPQSTTAAGSRGSGAVSPAPPAATLNQLMRAIMFPNSNVIFAAQETDPSTIKAAGEPSTATDPLTGSYGGWQAVENSGLALAEAARLLTVAGRKCSNGRPVPLQNADWARFVAGLRQAGLVAANAARAKNQDQILDAAEAVTNSCSNCHDVYREKTDTQGGSASRCTK